MCGAFLQKPCFSEPTTTERILAYTIAWETDSHTKFHCKENNDYYLFMVKRSFVYWVNSRKISPSKSDYIEPLLGKQLNAFMDEKGFRMLLQDPLDIRKYDDFLPIKYRNRNTNMEFSINNISEYDQAVKDFLSFVENVANQ